MEAGNVLVVLCRLRQGEAQIVRARLEDEGIPAALSYESLGIVYGLTIDGLGEVRVLVPESHIEQARAVLADSGPAESGGVDDLP